MSNATSHVLTLAVLNKVNFFKQSSKTSEDEHGIVQLPKYGDGRSFWVSEYTSPCMAVSIQHLLTSHACAAVWVSPSAALLPLPFDFPLHI